MKSNVLVTLFLVNGLAMLVASLPRDDKCSNCLSEPSTSSLLSAHWAMPLSRLGERQYYLGTFFKANWYKAAKYCRYHGMQLASIETQEENNILEEHVKSFGNQSFKAIYFNLFYLQDGLALKIIYSNIVD